MSERLSFGCACCSPQLLPAYRHDHDAWQSLLEGAAHQPAARGPMQAVIFHGGQIHPDPTQPDLYVEALGIAGGKVIASGTLQAVSAAMAEYAPLDRPLGADETLLPGLIDPHAHLVTSALMSGWTDLSAFNDQHLNTQYDKQTLATRLADAVVAATTATPPRQWVTGYGVDPSLMTSWEVIDAKFLDGISTKVKIFLLNASGHISYANTPALEAAGLKQDYPDGVLTEQQSAAVLGVMGPVTGDQILAGLGTVFQQANACGITTVFDASIGLFAGPDEVTMMKALAKTPAMTVRVGGALYGNGNDLMTWVNCYKPELQSDANALFTLRAVKLIADGSNQGLTGFQSRPYQCCEEHTVPGVGAYGLFNFDPVRKLADVMAVVSAAGWPILTHANGDEAISNVLAAYQTALSHVPPPPAPPRPFPTEPEIGRARSGRAHV